MKTMCKRLIALLGVLAMLLTFAACVEEHTHDYSEWGSNKTHHWKYCPEDQEKDESTLATHVDENADGKCDVCGYDVGLPHVHDYSAWGSDAEKHWKYCPDDNEKDASTEAAHADEDNDGKCDVCGRDMDLPDVTEVTVENVVIETVDGKPVLVVKGIMPTDIACIKLQANAADDNYFGDNVSTEVGKFELRFDLTQIRKDGEWAWFHIYTYDQAQPEDKTAYSAMIDLLRNDFLPGENVIDCDGVRYETANEGNWGLVVFYAKEIKQETTEITVDDIALDSVDSKPVLVVKGSMPSNIACIKLQANAGGLNYFADNVSTDSGKFEMHFDLTQIVADGQWAWFHIWTYADAEPEDLDAKDTQIDLMRGDFLPGENVIDYNGVRYETANSGNWGLVVFLAKEVEEEVPPTEEVTEVTVKEITLETIDGKAYVVVKGVMPTDIACIKLHADGNEMHFYADNIATEAGKFEFHFDLTETPLEGTPWLWFHLYVYEEAEPADESTPDEKINLQRGDMLKTWQYIDCGEVRYKVQDQGQLVIQPNTMPMAVVESMSVEVIDGKLMLVVKGTMPEEVPCIKIHAWADADYYGDNVSTEAGKFELHFDLTQVSAEGTPWMWFHLFIYTDAEPADLGAKALSIDLDRGTFFNVGDYADFDGIRYQVQNQGQLVIQPKNAE